MRKYKRDMTLNFKCKHCGQVFSREQHECFHINYNAWWTLVSEKLLQMRDKKIRWYLYFAFCPRCSRSVEAKENLVARVYLPRREGENNSNTAD